MITPEQENSARLARNRYALEQYHRRRATAHNAQSLLQAQAINELLELNLTAKQLSTLQSYLFEHVKSYQKPQEVE